MKLSIIIPVLNEAPAIVQMLSGLQPIRRRGHEVIVADGGSDDQSLLIATPFCDKVTQCLRGRSRQLNAGADLSTGEILLFLHADTFLPNDADRLIIEGMNDSIDYGAVSM
jgi:glycosyltransferase involved in cell wall biosynthesis